MEQKVTTFTVTSEDAVTLLKQLTAALEGKQLLALSFGYLAAPEMRDNPLDELAKAEFAAYTSDGTDVLTALDVTADVVEGFSYQLEKTSPWEP